MLKVQRGLGAMVQPLKEVAPGEEALIERPQEFGIGAAVLNRAGVTVNLVSTLCRFDE